jgi:hypothetical protein
MGEDGGEEKLQWDDGGAVKVEKQKPNHSYR